MVIAGVVALVLGLAIVWLVVRRGSRTKAITRANFDDRYDELVAEGQAEPRDHAAAWSEFTSWQQQTETERLEQQEETDE